ncbi:MAG: ABC transporter substrate-binding protein [Chloroflexota bacterium]
MIVHIGMDDTDNHESRGTGRLARAVAEELAIDFPLLGVTRHQLLVDPRIPYTSHNSSAVITLEINGAADLQNLFERVRASMLADFIPGSDPGLCLAIAQAAQALSAFGKRAQQEVVTQAEALALAQEHRVLLAGLGGENTGVIGALAAVGLAASGEDGRYLLVGRSRQLSGLLDPAAILAAGITAVRTPDGQPVEQGLILADKLRPARRGNQPILYVEWQQDHWEPLKLN